MKMLSLCLLLVCLGCSSTGRKIDHKSAAKIEKGMTMEQVRSMMGEPQTVASGDGVTTWIYQHTKATAKGRSFIPYVGGLVAGADIKQDTVSILFTDGVVSSVSTSQTKDEANTGLMVR